MENREISSNGTKKTRGKMVIFISGKGGVGKTVISVNTAVELAGRGIPTCIMDGDFQFGDLNLALDLQPSFTISDLVQGAESLDKVKISYYLDKHSSGVNVLSAPIKPEEADLIKASHIKVICEKILEEHDFLIVDLPSRLSENNLTFMELADEILLITDTSFTAIKNTKIMLRITRLLNMNDKIKVIINRANAKGLIKSVDVKNMLDIQDAVFISNDTKVVSKSFAMGIPFVRSKPRNRISRDIAAFADKFCRK
ncbi:MAG: P-loop NTPase [Clostridiaceae bacterium]